jgi:non-heme chloroperoxidase
MSFFMSEDRRNRTAQIAGAVLHYVEAGSGEPMVLVHGSLSDFRTWGFQRRAFSNRFRVIAYSRRGHYPNAVVPGDDYFAARHAEDLIAFILKLELGPVHLIGSSYGAYTALLAASERPDLVRTLVVGEPPILPLLKDDPADTKLLAAFLDTVWNPSAEAFRKDAFELGVRIFYEGITEAGAFEKLTPSSRKGIMENAGAMKSEATGDKTFPPFTRELARRILAPCLLLKAETSPLLFHRITDILADMLPNAETTVIRGSSHSMHVARPQEYNDTVMKFLSRHAGA